VQNAQTTAITTANSYTNQAVQNAVIGTINTATNTLTVGNPNNAAGQGGQGAPVAVTNVAPGAVNPTSTDAVNGSQLYGVQQTANAAQSTANSAVQAASAAQGTANTALAAAGQAQQTANSALSLGQQNSAQIVTLQTVQTVHGQEIQMLMNGVSGICTQNGNTLTCAQAKATGTNATATGAGAQSAGNGANASGANSAATGTAATATGAAAKATGTNATATGAGAQAAGDSATATGAGATAGTAATAVGTGAYAQGTGAYANPDPAVAIGYYANGAGNDSVAIGTQAQATGEQSVAIGAHANASGNNSVAIGSGSTDGGQSNVVSVGAPGNERRITNVAPGINGTDAVNVNQLAGAYNDLRNRINATGAMAAAMSNIQLPPGYTKGLGVAVGTQGGQGALAVGFVATPRPNILTKITASLSSDTASVGAGITFGW